MTPQSHGSSPYIIVSGRPPPIIRQVSTNLPQVRGDEISQLMKQLGKVINQVTKFVQESCHFPLGNRFTNLCVGIRCGQGLDTRLLSPQWKGPYTVVLTRPTADKVEGVTPWIHRMRVEREYHADLEDAEWNTLKDPTDP